MKKKIVGAIGVLLVGIVLLLGKMGPGMKADVLESGELLEKNPQSLTITEASVNETYRLNKKKLSLAEGESFALKLRGVSARKVTWKSSDKGVAAVSKAGKVTAKKAGNADITAVYKKIEYKCRVTVTAPGSGQAEEEEQALNMKIDGTAVSVAWENNASVQALRELVKEEPLEIQMSMYGGFEQVGSLGTKLPKNDKEITTKAGDIVLYTGSQLVVFYGSNSWAYTRLGAITDKSAEELTELLGNGDVSITLSMEK